jgi:hypothetical protein
MKFRSIDNKVFIDFTLKGRASSELSPIFAYDLSPLNLNAGFEFGIGTAIRPVDLLTESLEVLVQKLFTISVTSKGNLLITVLSKFINKLVKQGNGSEIRVFKVLATLLGFLRVVPNIETTINMQPQEIINFIKDTESLNGTNYYKMIEDGNVISLSQIKDGFEMLSLQYSPMLADYKEIITGLNFEDITFNAYSKALSLNFECDLKICGMDELLNKFFAN